MSAGTVASLLAGPIGATDFPAATPTPANSERACGLQPDPPHCESLRTVTNSPGTSRTVPAGPQRVAIVRKPVGKRDVKRSYPVVIGR